MSARHVLVFPAGTEIGLEIQHALKDCKEVRLFGAGQDIPNHGKFAYGEYHRLPHIGDPNWLPALQDLCETLSIDYIIPAYDDVIVALSRVSDQLSAAVITSPREACEITRSKSQTYAALTGIVAVPHLYADAADVDRFPVFVKPDRGQGSFGARRIENREQLDAALADVPGSIICEFLPGEEYTVDCFSDRERGLLFAQARGRRRVRNGISVNSITQDIEGVPALAAKIGARLGLRGAWFFQLKRAANGELTLLEVAPRIAGAMALHRVTGVNFPLMSIFEHERKPLGILVNPGEVEIDRALVNRYRHSISFATLYVDLDDTLILGDAVNTRLVALIFQCLNAGKRVNLITRHASDLNATLRRHRLSGLFDRVIHLRDGESKADYIAEPDAIFIDDSFRERLDVTKRLGIPTFDCSMIEMLTQQAESMNARGASDVRERSVEGVS
ncbi:ATP-grasp domain-containing protein [Caballeronia sp. BR00000012568055]|uniref:ATP-grasp domain-containing protein n=1 Tax=Caballeronia sp. BR00000012568055 TaxID=2918761 RepID=UPI0023F8B988|nr:ATP-grasp domain-containing protein [Caballeronia sp. BR00000012568055]